MPQAAVTTTFQIGENEFEDLVGDLNIRFELTEEWRGELIDAADAIALYDPSRPAGIYIFRFTGEVFAHACDPNDTMEIEASPEAVMGWLAAHPNLQVAEPQAVGFDDAQGLTSRVNGIQPEPCPDLPPDARPIFLFSLPVIRDYRISDGSVAEIAVVEADDEIVIVSAEADGPDAAQFFEVARPVLESLSLD